MEIDSRPGKGASIQIRFPVPGHSKFTEGTSEEEPELLSLLRILVIDDESRSRNIIARFLKVDGHSVETAENGQKGVEMARQGEFHLVITDRAMPLMNGDEVAANITKAKPGTPVIMLTGFGNIMKDAADCPPGVTHVMTKPITRADLNHAMSRIMHGQQTISIAKETH